MQKRRYFYLILVILITIFIFSNSLMPADVSSAQSGFFTSLLKKILLIFDIVLKDNELSFIVRKTAHFSQFFFWGLFCFLFIKTFVKEVFEPYVLTLNYGLMVAMTDELIQNYVPGRAMESLDVLIDISGVIASLIVSFIIINIVYRHKKKRPFN